MGAPSPRATSESIPQPAVRAGKDGTRGETVEEVGEALPERLRKDK